MAATPTRRRQRLRQRLLLWMRLRLPAVDRPATIWSETKKKRFHCLQLDLADFSKIGALLCNCLCVSVCVCVSASCQGIPNGRRVGPAAVIGATKQRKETEMGGRKQWEMQFQRFHKHILSIYLFIYTSRSASRYEPWAWAATVEWKFLWVKHWAVQLEWSKQKFKDKPDLNGHSAVQLSRNTWECVKKQTW